MSTELHNTGHGSSSAPAHGDVAFEPRDVKVSSVLKFLVVLGITLAVAYAICLGVYRSSMAHIAKFDTPPPPVRQGLPALLPPEPRLQGVPGHDSDPQQDLRDKLAADSKALGETRWVDEKAGIAQIPIEDAMKIIAEKGLPAVSAPPAARKK